MVIGVLQVALVIQDARSLKQKRQALKGLVERIRNRFNVSAAETGDQDLWQRAELGVAIVTNEQAFADRVLAKVVDLVRATPGVTLVDYETEFL